MHGVHQGRPQLVCCYICGREFGSKSISIHEPHCLEKWNVENEQLPSHQRRPPPQKPQIGRGGSKSTQEWNNAAYKSAQANLLSCENCGRTFNPDRLGIHQRSCRPGRPLKPLPNRPGGDSASGQGDRPPSASMTRVLRPSNRIDVSTPPVPSISRRTPDTQSTGGRYDYGRQSEAGMSGRTPTTNRTGTVSKSVSFQSTSQSSSSTSYRGPTPSRSVPANSRGPAKPGGMNRSMPAASNRQSRGGKFVFCYICGRQFTDASLPIHEPQCLQKWEVQNSLLPKSERRPPPRKPENLSASAASGLTREQLQEAQWQAAKSNLVPCRNCGRRFAPDRVGIHERICKAPPKKATPQGGFDQSQRGGGDFGGPNTTRSEQPERRSGPPVKHARTPKFVFCYICGRQFTDASLPIHEPQCLQKWEVQNNLLPRSERRPPPKKPQVLSGAAAGQMSREELQEAQWQAAKENRVPCRNCGRRFAPDRVAVHERICKPSKKQLAAEQDDGESSSPPQGKSGAPMNNKTFSRPPPSRENPGGGGGRTGGGASGAGGGAGGAGGGTGGGGYKVPARPRTVVCYICGREFGSKSIDIHQPQCLQKWHIENDKLPPHQRRAEPQKPQVAALTGRGGSYDLAAVNDAAFQTAMDNRVPCSNCGRKFNPDRVAVHERSCHPKPPRQDYDY